MGKREKRLLRGNASRPRLVVFRSHQHIYAQVIDDVLAQTLLSCSTLEAEIQKQVNSTATIEASHLVGQTLGKRLSEKNIKHLVFDRNQKPYHGRVKALAEGARTAGLDF